MSKPTDIPTVPLRTPMFDGPDFTKLCGNLDRVWIIFFERRLKAAASGGGGGPYIRTLLVKDSTVGNDIADHVPIWIKSTATRVIGVLRKAISSDLTIRVNLDGAALITLTIPLATPIDTPVTSTSFSGTAFTDLQVLTWDITASPGTKDVNGIASLTVQFI